MNDKRILIRTTVRRLAVIDALAEMENQDRDFVVNAALYEWAKERVDDDLMLERLKMIFLN